MKPLPWSPTGLDTFKSCPAQYYHKYVAKDLPEEKKTRQQLEGDRAHKAFELYVDEDKPLPADLERHAEFLDKLKARAGVHWVEAKVAFTKKLEPVTWDYPRRDEIWWRGMIDFRKVDAEDPRATIVDYKTGKPHEKWDQLAQYALHTFYLFPKVELVDASFYWTQTCTRTRKVWGRAQIDELWGKLTPDLKQYALAFKSDTWQERPSGLCHGWCPVRDCQHWRPMR